MAPEQQFTQTDYRKIAEISGIDEKSFDQALYAVQSGGVRKGALTPRGNIYTARFPLFPKQKAFALLPQLDAMTSGAGGTGKTELLLYLALQYVDVAGYSALVLRRTYSQLKLANSILDRFLQRTQGLPMRWNGMDYRAEFPGNSKITFGHVDTASDMYKYDSAEFSTIIIDEAIQFTPDMLQFFFSRLRRPKTLSHIPLRYRLATNPGGISHLYLRNHYLESDHPDRASMLFYLEDNPGLDTEAYLKSLSNLNPLMYRQRRYGDWYATASNTVLPREWLAIRETPLSDGVLRVRFWDLAATAPKPGKDPDWTVGTLLARDRFGKFLVEDVCRFRANPAEVEERIVRTAEADGRGVYVRMEQEGGASGKSLVNAYSRLLAGWNFAGIPAGGPKLSRWGPVSGQARNGNLFVMPGPWASDWFDEVCSVTGVGDVHDDQIDSLAGAYTFFVNERPIAGIGVKRL